MCSLSELATIFSSFSNTRRSATRENEFYATARCLLIGGRGCLSFGCLLINRLLSYLHLTQKPTRTLAFRTRNTQSSDLDIVSCISAIRWHVDGSRVAWKLKLNLAETEIALSPALLFCFLSFPIALALWLFSGPPFWPHLRLFWPFALCGLFVAGLPDCQKNMFKPSLLALSSVLHSSVTLYFYHCPRPLDLYW